MARYDDLKTGPIAYAAFVSTVSLVILILLFRALCYSWIGYEDETKVANAHYVSADAKIAEQVSRISSYDKEMVDVAPPAGSEASQPPTQVERLHIPVTQAKAILLKELTPSSTK